MVSIDLIDFFQVLLLYNVSIVMSILEVSLVALVKLIVFDFEFSNLYLLEFHLLTADGHFFIAIIFNYFDLFAELLAFML